MVREKVVITVIASRVLEVDGQDSDDKILEVGKFELVGLEDLLHNLTLFFARVRENPFRWIPEQFLWRNDA